MTVSIPAQPDMRQPANIKAHVRSVLDFYDGRSKDPTGGFYQFFKDNGDVYNRVRRHMVSSTRYVVLWSMASRHFGEPRYLEYARHAVLFLHDVHLQPAGNYIWELDWQDNTMTVVDDTQHCYALAFAVLAYSHAVLAGLNEARPWLDEAKSKLDSLLWQPEFGAYADEATAEGVVSSYRGQNANMHCVEAFLAAHDATGEVHYLDRACQVAETVTKKLASLSKTDEGWIWEHYNADWTIDWHYNEGDASNLYRPWGYQPGHFTEWAHLLLVLDERRPQSWYLPRAIELFDAAMKWGWDSEHGGLFYGFGPGGKVCFAEKYHWVQCETIATCALLGARTGEAKFWEAYDKLWAYCWVNWVDHEHGAWWRILSPDNKKITDEKSPASKVDYHTTGACYCAMEALSKLPK